MKNRKSKIMLIESSENLRFVLKDCLEKMGYKVSDFADGETAMRSYEHGSCDICLLNTELPKKDGYCVIRELHYITPDLPVIFVTEKERKTERIRAFEAGCEDYLTKPFGIDELLTRIEVVLNRNSIRGKRSNSAAETVFHIGDFTFNYHNKTVSNTLSSRILTRKEAQLLRLLCEYKNKLIPREIILKELWDESKAASGRSLDVYISKLRLYLQSNKVEILNVHGKGYLLVISD
jgi:DNA-binding response OmpR family regulator